MKSVLLIGLGRFGRHIAMKLNEMRHQVMAVDKNEQRVNAVLPFVMNAQIGDATNEEFIFDPGRKEENYDYVRLPSDSTLKKELEERAKE